MIYTIQNTCVEVPELPYDDGAKTDIKLLEIFRSFLIYSLLCYVIIIFCPKSNLYFFHTIRFYTFVFECRNSRVFHIIRSIRKNKRVAS